jgi:hypothetical protein
MKIGRGNQSTRRKVATAPFCPPQIPHDQGLNPVRRSGKPATKRLSYGAAFFVYIIPSVVQCKEDILKSNENYCN